MKSNELGLYVNEIKMNLNSLESTGCSKQESLQIMALACQCYMADHMNQNVSATINQVDQEGYRR